MISLHPCKTSQLIVFTTMQLSPNRLVVGLVKRFAVLCLFTLFAFPALAAPRSVALVYDDSGSMRSENRWLYANYALQALTAFLGNEDTLYLVTMSDYNNAQSFSGVQAKHDLLERLKHDGKPDGDTAYQAIERAMQSLRDADVNHEKWLVIITDGEFFSKKDMDKNLIQQLEQQASAFTQTTGSRSVMLLIGQQADQSVADIWQHSAQATILKAANSKEIVERLHDTAAMLTSRDQRATDLQSEVRNNTLIVSPRFPLRRLTIFAKSKDAKNPPPIINNISVDGGDGEQDAYHLQMVPSSKDRSQSMISHITPKAPATLIHEGHERLRLTFDRAIDFDFRLYPEVAARLDVVLRDGKGSVLTTQNSNTIEVCENAPLSIHAQLMASDNKTLMEGQTDSKSFKVNYLLNDTAETNMPLNAAQTEFAAPIQLKSGISAISVSAAYPGYFNFRSRIYTLKTIDCKPREMSIDADNSTWHEPLTEMPSAKVILQGKIDGKAITPGEFQAADMKIISDTEVAFTLSKDEAQQQWLLRPEYKWGCACFTASGLQEVEVLLTGERTNEQVQRKLTLNVQDVSWWQKCGLLAITGILLLLLLWYVFGIYKKPRFRQGSIVTYKHSNRTQTEHLPSSWFNRWLVPYVPEKRFVGSVLFIAGLRSHYILLSKKSQNDNMTISGLSVDDPGRRDLRLDNGEILEISGRHTESYTYSSLL